VLLLCVYSEKSEKERKGNNNVSKTSAFCVNLVSVSSVLHFSLLFRFLFFFYSSSFPSTYWKRYNTRTIRAHKQTQN